MEENEELRDGAGILVGLVVVDGHEMIGVRMTTLLGDAQLALNVDAAAVVFNQLGDLLDEFGYFDEEEPKCACH